MKDVLWMCDVFDLKKPISEKAQPPPPPLPLPRIYQQAAAQTPEETERLRKKWYNRVDLVPLGILAVIVGTYIFSYFLKHFTFVGYLIVDQRITLFYITLFMVDDSICFLFFMLFWITGLRMFERSFPGWTMGPGSPSGTPKSRKIDAKFAEKIVYKQWFLREFSL